MRNIHSKIILIITLVFGFAIQSKASLGIQTAIGLPFLSQTGINYYFSNSLGLDISTNALNLDLGTASINLSMPQVLVNYHPFAGSFFIGLGMGQLTSSVSATDSTTSIKISAEIKANTTVGKMGWMWGFDNGGFWFGIDYSMIMPSNPTTTITAPGVSTTSSEYLDLVDASTKYGESSLGNITYARFGWQF